MFFKEFEDSYTEKWDVPAMFNTRSIVPKELRALPVSVKTVKQGSPIAFGDAIRQFNINEEFVLIVGFWKQSGSAKNFVAVEATKISIETWRKLWNPLSLENLLELDALIKDYQMHYKTVREQAKAMKSSSPFNSAMMVLNPKVDSKNQRRLQCSLPFRTFWREIAEKEPSETKKPTLFGKSVPNPFFAPPRTFKRL